MNNQQKFQKKKKMKVVFSGNLTWWKTKQNKNSSSNLSILKSIRFAPVFNCKPLNSSHVGNWVETEWNYGFTQIILFRCLK